MFKIPWWLPYFGDSLQIAGSLGGLGQLAEIDRQLQVAVSNPIRIGFISLAGGVGCSTLVHDIGALLAAKRDGDVLVVAGDSSSRVMQLSGARVQPAADQKNSSDRHLRRQVATENVQQMLSGIPVTKSGLRAIGHTNSLSVVSPEQWAQLVNPVARYFEIILGDWGKRSLDIDFTDAVNDCDVAVLVCRADRFSTEMTHSVASALAVSGTITAVCAVDVAGNGEILGNVCSSWPEPPVFGIPYEKTHAGWAQAGLGYRLAVMRTASRLLALGLEATR